MKIKNDRDNKIKERQVNLLIGAGIFLAAVALRAVFLLESRSNPTFHFPIVDAGSYHQFAKAFAEGKGVNTDFFFQSFFYPAFLAVMYSLGGVSLLKVKVFQIVLSGTTCVLTWLLGERLFNRKTGVAAGLIVAGYGPLILFDGELLAVSWSAFWAVSLVLFLLYAAESKSLWLGMAWGVVGALATLTRPEFLLFFLAGSCWITIQRYKGCSDHGKAGRLEGWKAGRLEVSLSQLLSAFPLSLRL